MAHQPYVLTVSRGGRVMHQTTGGIGTGLAIGGGVVAILALGIAFGVAPGALIAHYGFHYAWGESIAIGIGVMLALGLISSAIHPTVVQSAPTGLTTS